MKKRVQPQPRPKTKKYKACTVLKLFICVFMLIYVYFIIGSIFSYCMAFQGSPPFQWPSGKHIKVMSVFYPLLDTMWLMTIIYFLILLPEKMAGEFLKSRSKMNVLLLIIAVIQLGLGILQIIKYGSWTICSGTEVYVWHEEVWQIHSLLIVPMIVSVILLLMEIGEFVLVRGRDRES